MCFGNKYFGGDLKMYKKQLIKTFKSNGHNGNCVGCKSYFKKNEYVIIFEKYRQLKLTEIKICMYCYLNQLAKKVGWKAIHDFLLKLSVRRL